MKKTIVWLLITLAVGWIGKQIFTYYAAYELTKAAVEMGERAWNELDPPDAGEYAVTCCDKDGSVIKHPKPPMPEARRQRTP